MSLWTPGGEVPVERNRGAARTRAGATRRPGAGPVISEEALAEAAAAAGIDLATLSRRGAGPARGDDGRDGRGPGPAGRRPRRPR